MAEHAFQGMSLEKVVAWRGDCPRVKKRDLKIRRVDRQRN
jgi:hypothetical protein